MGIKRKLESQDSSRTTIVTKKPRNQPDNKLLVTESSARSYDSLTFIEKPTISELKREVNLYDKLASEDEPERLNAADQIVTGLLGGEGCSEETLLRHLERKLLRGLASGRKSARLGYSIVLTEVLSQLFGFEKMLAKSKYRSLKLENILQLLLAKTKPEGDLNGQEIKDHALGLLFGLQSFVRAKILFHSMEHWEFVLEQILGLAKKKSWIREECGWIAIEALTQMNEDQALVTLRLLCDHGLSKSPEGVGIWLTVRNKFPSFNFLSIPRVWGESANPLDHLQSLAKVLRESSGSGDNREDLQEAQQPNLTGNWNPKLHFVWDIIISELATKFKKEENCSLNGLTRFWKIVVDENLFASTATRERKFWGLLLFQKVVLISQTFTNIISSIFTPNLLRCLINHSHDKDRFLNRAAEKSLKAVVNTIQSNPQLLPNILPYLIGRYGAYNFDRITKTKTINHILDFVTKDNCESVTAILEKLANEIYEDDKIIAFKEAESRRLMLGDYLFCIIRKQSKEDEKSSNFIRATTLKAVAKYSYTKLNGIEPVVSEKTRQIFRNRLSSALAYLLTDLSKYNYVCDLLEKCEPTAIDMDLSIQNVKNNAEAKLRKILKKLKKIDNNKETKILFQAICLLYSLMIFQLYNGEPEALSCLEELDLCYLKLVRKQKSDQCESQVPEVLVELLLSLISKPSALLRKVAKFVFGAFLTHITVEGINLMTDVLETSENLRGQENLFDEDEDNVSVVEVEKLPESDVEIVDRDAHEGSYNAQIIKEDLRSNEDFNSDSHNEEICDDEEENDKLNSALAMVLGANLDTGLESENNSDMTDSEMLALDEKLVEIFSQRKRNPKKKKEQKRAKETICNFKSRILDLVEIYVKNQANKNLAFHLILPLIRLIRSTQSKNIADRAHGILYSFIKAYKKLPLTELELDENLLAGRLELLKQIHEEASKQSSHLFCKVASSASLLVVSSIYRINFCLIKEVANVYLDTQIKWVLGQASVQAVFFTDWINWCQSHISNEKRGLGVC